MKTEEEIKKKSERLEKILNNQMDYFYAFDPSSYDDLSNKMKEIEGEYIIISRLVESEEELKRLLKEKKDS